MIPRIPEDLVHFLESFSTYYVIGHTEPDGDCIASQLAVSWLLEKLGKGAVPVSPGPFARPEIAGFESRFRAHLPEHVPPGSAVIVVDCSTIDRIGYLGEELRERELETAVIDHHASGRPFGSVRFIEPDAPSVTYLIHHIIDSFAVPLDTATAELLAFGLATDTGFFRHLEEGSADVFRAMGRLVDAGASPKRVHSLMYGGRTMDERMHLSRLLGRTKSLFGGKLLITREILSDRADISGGNRDSDQLYLLLTTLQGARVVAYIKEEAAGRCTVGLRANGDVDVGNLARGYGGGGHRKASGFDWAGTPDEIEDRLVELFEPILSGLS